MKPAKFITARSTVISLFSAVTLSLLAANLIPQQATLGDKSPAWADGLPQFSRIVTSLGLDNIVGSSWFAILMALFSVSLLVSTCSQFMVVRRLASQLPTPHSGGNVSPVAVEIGSFREAAIRHGYKPSGSVAGLHRFVRCKAGYWGNFLLHLGLVTVVLFSLVHVVTRHRALVRVTEGEITPLLPGTTGVSMGIFPVRRLPEALVLTRLTPRFWRSDKLESLASELRILDAAGSPPVRVDVAISEKSHYGSFLVYQGTPFGIAFDLEVVSAATGVSIERLFLPYTMRRDVAGYGEKPLPGTDLVIKAKFVPDEKKETMEPRAPLLTLRIFRGTELLGEAPLHPGDRKDIGPLNIRLARTAWWTDILLDGSRGIAGIFAGFAVILTGVLFSYCLIPREIIVEETGDTLLVQHRVRRFAHLYREEFMEIIGSLQGNS